MRNIRRNLVSSSINIVGMSIAISFAVSIFIFTDIMRSMDSFHSNANRIYQITNYVEGEGGQNMWSDSPMLLCPAMKKDHPSVETYSRIEYRSASVKHKTDVFDELVTFVDPDFFKMFDYEMVTGEKAVLENKSQIVISHDMALKYFKDEDPIGKDLSFKFLNGAIKRFSVGAVLEKYPYNASMQFSFFIPIENFRDLRFEGTEGWSFMTDGSFIMLEEGESISSIYDSFDSYINVQHGSNPEWKVESFEAIRLDDLSSKAYQIEGSISGGAHPAGTLALTIIAVFLLAMACFNFMNISVVSASKRLKEIGLRKVMGGVKKEIVYQFMVVNLLKCFFALIVGFLLSYFLLLPLFDVMVPELDVQFRTNDASSMVIFLVGLLVTVGVISGLYPSFYISKFDAISIFKGKEKFGSKNLLSKVLLGFQFFLAVMTIIGCFIFTEQNLHLSSKSWGYDPTGTMSVYVANEEQYELLKNEIVNHPAVDFHTSSDLLIGRSVRKISLEQGDRQLGVRRLSVSEDYFATFRLNIKEGRALTDRAEDRVGRVVVNESFVKAMDWTDPVGKTFSHDSTMYSVVGVVQDFHYYDFFSAIEPVMIRGLESSDVRYLSIQVKPDRLAEIEAYARQSWQKIAPDDPFDRIFQEDVFERFYTENRGNTGLLLLITGITIILACLGLYGLLSFNVQSKLKEFSVRKVLGAEPNAIIRIVAKQYFWVLLISFMIGAPLGSFGMYNLIVTVFPEPKAVTVLPFIVAMFIILLTLIITVAGQISKAIRVNPSELLRSE